MTKNSIVKLTPEIVAAVFAELECHGDGMPTEKGWGELVETSGIGIATSNAVRRAFDRNEWETAWPMIDHLARYFLPLADAEAREKSAAIVEAGRALANASWSERSLVALDAALEDFSDWALDGPPATRCLGLALDLVSFTSGEQEPGRVFSGSRADSVFIAEKTAQLLANEVSDSAAREFVASIEALGATT